jgi:hypothetical protein
MFRLSHLDSEQHAALIFRIVWVEERFRLKGATRKFEVLQTGQLECTEFDLARKLTVSLHRNRIDEKLIMARVQDVRRQLDSHPVICGYDTFPKGDRFEKQLICIHVRSLNGSRTFCPAICALQH